MWCGISGAREATVAELAPRLSASGDLFNHGGRRAWASVNFVTAHDGFTLNDWASYNDKHNEANGEDNKDGSSSNRSWNCGAEGPTDDKTIIELRNRQKRNMLATLLFSQGTPMMLGGDEFGRTQQGNNNAYCQDSEISWFDWQLGEDANALLAYHQAPDRAAQSLPHPAPQPLSDRTTRRGPRRQGRRPGSMPTERKCRTRTGRMRR